MRMTKRSIILGVALIVMGLAGALVYAIISGVSASESVGGGWKMERREYLAGIHRSSPTSLYHKRDGRDELVDQYVENARYYGDECVAYVTLKTGEKQYFAVCGDRERVLLATEVYEDWLFEAEGLQKLAWVEEGNTMSRRRTARIPLDEIKKRAQSQPQRRRPG